MESILILTGIIDLILILVVLTFIYYGKWVNIYQSFTRPAYSWKMDMKYMIDYELNLIGRMYTNYPEIIVY